MPVYRWEGRRIGGGGRVRGQMEAPDEATVRARLRAQNVVVLRVQEQRGRGGGLPRIKRVELATLTKQLGTMIRSGLPLVQALMALERQSKAGALLRAVREDVEQGSSFADALRKHPRSFDELYVNLVASGEMAGALDRVLERLAGYLERMVQIQRRVRGALVYPLAVAGIATLIVIFLLVYVIPMFERLFAELGGTLPAFTRLVIGISALLRANFLWVLLGAVALSWGARRLLRVERVRRVVDLHVLRLPVFGKIFHLSALARLCRTLSTLLASGVLLLDALQIAGRASGNRAIEEAIERVRQEVTQGATLSEPLGREERLFPLLMVQMVSVGEQTGNLDQMVEHVAGFYEAEVDTTVDALTTLIEPLMMVVLGGTIGALLIAMYLPIFKIASLVG